ncbi:MAG: hypothetical protein QM817_07015 [Archangium sp.]
MASKKKAKKAVSKKKKVVSKPKKKLAKAKKPIAKKKTKAKAKARQQKPARVVSEMLTTQVEMFDVAATQAVPVGEVVGEIEERMALDKLTEG